MPISADTHVRLARPSRDLAAAVRFWADGLGLDVLYRGAADGPGEHGLVARLERAGGTRVSAGPYWDRWGITFADPDGYRLVLCTRTWSND
ncbi:VOC family protein [Micromonospora sp. AKA38]|uniref:VOC family protein n=1 Tax=Micromonospora sp. AKA38 TaxID=2733861 RepID=UPI0022CBFD17|nr:hypothetical protein [Micromonospora sp. AKA38]GHJ15030.1 glyoxalase/bleomycin resistance protein/dioxygenase [Micromonospora sp. AKA38]